ncbi:MAG: hypothetical protein EOP88_00160 [Verrucomicrobiaceae bacterium]|nr:MAG: hypothetical protein EOP88_00160 [Verrucomicrobiaceae bacterium]
MNFTNPSVRLVDEACYSFGSADNRCRYPVEVNLSEGFRPSSVLGLLVDDVPTIVVGSGGTGGGHDDSLLRLGAVIYFVVGRHVCRFSLGMDRLDWTLATDEYACFGIHHCQVHDCLISHGELAICRFSPDGEILWSAGGADIFSEGFALHDDFIEAVDFNGRRYRFDHATGRPMDR